MSNPIFKFSHPDFPKEELFFIYSLESELSETIPLDLTTFVWYYLETKQSLDYLFNQWASIMNNSTSIQDTSFENYFDEVHRQQFYMDAEFANSVQLAIQNQAESVELKKLLISKDNQNRINHFDFSFVHKDIKYYQGRHFIDLYFKSNFDKSIKDEILISDQEIILSLVKKSGLGLYFASELLKSDLEFIKEVLKFDFRAIYFAHDSIKNNSAFVSDALNYDREFCISMIIKIQNEILQENQVEEYTEDYDDEYMQDDEFTSETFSVYFDGIEKSTYFDYLQNHCSFDLSSWKLDRPIAYHYLKDDAKYVLQLFEIWPGGLNFSLFELASARLLNSKEFILQFFKSFEYNSALVFKWSNFPSFYWTDREVVFEIISKYENVLEYISDELKNDREIIFRAIKNQGKSFQFASDDLKKDSSFVIEAIKISSDVLKYVSDELINDFSFIIEAIKFSGDVLKYVSIDLKNNREIVTQAVKTYSRALEFASVELKNNREVVFEAVKKIDIGFPSPLVFASEELRNDREIVFVAVKNYGYALKYASETLKNDFEFILSTVKNNGKTLEFASEGLRDNFAIVLEAVKQNGKALEFASDKLRNNREIVLEAVKNSGYALEYVSEELSIDREIVTEALKTGEEILFYVDENIYDEFSSMFLNETEEGENFFDDDI
jgi:hypothetical protein